MPWKETCPMDQKLQFIAAWQAGGYTVAELARLFSISRKTAYKWIQRYQSEGVVGLCEQSRAPHHQPNRIPEAQEAILLAQKGLRPSWGPKKVRDRVRLDHPEQRWPAVSTVGELFKRRGLVKPRGRRRRGVPAGQPLGACRAPNEVWSADFKGQFRLGNGRYCYPLTVSDNDSRYLLVCQGLYRPTEQGVWGFFERAFCEYGLPLAMRTDNGSPFASTALGGLTRLNVWWIKLGITPERIEAGHPEQNGRHERMHLTLQEEVATPPKGNLSAQQRALNGFRQDYNEYRPHESLQGIPPAQRYQSSNRPYPSRLAEVEYDEGLRVRRVRSTGEIKWGGRLVFVTEALRGEWVGLKQVDDYRWMLYFAHVELGILDEIRGKIERL